MNLKFNEQLKELNELKKDQEYCTFKPQINQKSQQIINNNKDITLQERLDLMYNKGKMTLLNRKDKSTIEFDLEKNKEECTFKPTIGNYNDFLTQFEEEQNSNIDYLEKQNELFSKYADRLKRGREEREIKEKALKRFSSPNNVSKGNMISSLTQSQFNSNNNKIDKNENYLAHSHAFSSNKTENLHKSNSKNKNFSLGINNSITTNKNKNEEIKVYSLNSINKMNNSMSNSKLQSTGIQNIKNPAQNQNKFSKNVINQSSGNNDQKKGKYFTNLDYENIPLEEDSNDDELHHNLLSQNTNIYNYVKNPKQTTNSKSNDSVINKKILHKQYDTTDSKIPILVIDVNLDQDSHKDKKQILVFDGDTPQNLAKEFSLKNSKYNNFFISIIRIKF